MIRPTLSIAVTLLLAGTLAAEATTPQAAAPAERPATAVDRSDELVYGPILAEDSATRLAIKRLYRQIRSTQETTSTELELLYGELEQESDMDFRRDIARQIGDLKAGLEMTNIELRGEIAHLNGDEARAAEFALALDQLRNPDKYFTLPTDLPVRDPAAR